MIANSLAQVGYPFADRELRRVTHPGQGLKTFAAARYRRIDTLANVGESPARHFGDKVTLAELSQTAPQAGLICQVAICKCVEVGL
ncbi:hypothetical protein GCM10027567_11610 [Spongiibacter taiwanensis]